MFFKTTGKKNQKLISLPIFNSLLSLSDLIFVSLLFHIITQCYKSFKIEAADYFVTSFIVWPFPVSTSLWSRASRASYYMEVLLFTSTG